MVAGGQRLWGYSPRRLCLLPWSPGNCVSVSGWQATLTWGSKERLTGVRVMSHYTPEH